MRRRSAAFVLSFVVFVSLFSSSTRAQTISDTPTTEIDSSVIPFYDALARYGQWVVSQKWGAAWQPREATNVHFRPYYSRGRWVFSDQGWAFDSPMPWSRIAFHYGRWVYSDEVESWLWLPGTTWAAAHVSWQWNDEVVGWAPLEPDNLPFAYDNETYRVFVSARDLSAPNFESFIVSVARADVARMPRENATAGPPRHIARRVGRVVHLTPGVPRPRVHRAPPIPRPAPRRRVVERPRARTRRIALAAPGASFVPPPEPPPPVARAVLHSE